MRINLVSGATGFVGRYLTSALLEKGEQVWIIVRPSSNESAETRAKKILSRFFLKWPSALRVIEGDVIAKDLGIKDSIIENLKDSEVVFWHLAATLDLTDQNEAGIWKTNAIGTCLGSLGTGKPGEFIKVCRRAGIKCRRDEAPRRNIGPRTRTERYRSRRT